MPKQGFISWSGTEAREIAEALQQLFRYVLASPQIFVASKDLKAGDLWFSEIAGQLDACDVGVIIVTPENRLRPWLHFEAGAIAKRVGRSAAIPLLSGVSIGDLANTPLAQMQAIGTAKEEIAGLCVRLNELLELRLAAEHISEAFDMWWEKLGPTITQPPAKASAPSKPATPTISDISVQLTQLAADVAALKHRIPSPRATDELYRVMFDHYPPARRPTENALSDLFETISSSDVAMDDLRRELQVKLARSREESHPQKFEPKG